MDLEDALGLQDAQRIAKRGDRDAKQIHKMALRHKGTRGQFSLSLKAGPKPWQVTGLGWTQSWTSAGRRARLQTG